VTIDDVVSAYRSLHVLALAFQIHSSQRKRDWCYKLLETKVRMVWGSFLVAAAALKTPTRNGSNAQGVNLTLYIYYKVCSRPTSQRRASPSTTWWVCIDLFMFMYILYIYRGGLPRIHIYIYMYTHTHIYAHINIYIYTYIDRYI